MQYQIIIMFELLKDTNQFTNWHTITVHCVSQTHTLHFNKIVHIMKNIL